MSLSHTARPSRSIVSLVLFLSPLLGAQELSVPGSLQVTLAPPDAVTGGARWRVDGGAWQDSGAVATGLVPGKHRVEVSEAPGWIAPPAFSVLVIGGRTAAARAACEELTSFAVGSVPPATVWHGQTLRFRVVADPVLGVPASMTSSPRPAGPISFDREQGTFAYTPGVDDTRAFAVAFKSASGATLQEVELHPLQILPPETEVISHQRPVPDPESKAYLSVSETLSEAAEEFNGSARRTRIVSLAGKTVLIDRESPKNGLFASYHEAADVKELRIHAETVVIRSLIHLPQTNVTVYARELRFEDKAGTAELAAIDTTPRTARELPAELEDGKPGARAGSIALHVERLHSDRQARRFILRGGDGQAAGPGRNGAAGKSLCPMEQCFDSALPVSAVYGEAPAWPTWGTREWPGDGQAALPAGKPGDGGPGGDVRSTLTDVSALAALIDHGGGSAGLRGTDTVGGSPGTPNPARWVRFVPRSLIGAWHNLDDTGIDNVLPFDDTLWHTAVRGADAVAPDAAVPVGRPGSLAVIPSPHSWLHPFALKSVILHARDAYLHGNLGYTEEVLEEYVVLLDAYEAFPAEHAAAFTEMRQDMADLLHRIRENLDYFGNPAGWVPMLSFEANYLAFASEIESAIDVLYTTHWLLHSAASAAGKLAAMQGAVAQLEAERARATGDFNQARLSIPGLQVRTADILGQIGSLEAGLAQLEASLLQQASTNVKDRHKVPSWRRAAATVGAVLKVIPVYQPVLGAVGTGLSYVSKIEAGSTPREVIEGGVEVAKAFDKSQFTARADEFAAKLKSLGECKVSGSFEDYKQCFESVKAIGSQLSKGMESVKEAMKVTQIPHSEVEAELLRIKAASPEFRNLVDQVRQLNVEKMRFGAQLGSAMQAVSNLAVGIQQNLLAADGLERQLGAASNQLDHTAVLHVKEMQQRTMSRLLKYHYYLAKAFEYRLLEPYDGTFQLNALFDRLQDLLVADDYQLLSREQLDDLKAVYTEELEGVAARIFDQLNANAPERSAPRAFSLTSGEIAALNAAGRVTINLVEKGLFSPSEENLRIADLRAVDVQARIAGGASPSAATLVLTFEHSGSSRLAFRGHTYSFTHYQTAADNPIYWQTVYDARRKSWTQSEPSDGSESLLKALLERAGRDADDILLYSRPAAWADIEVTREVAADSGHDVLLEGLELEVRYDFYRQRTTQASLAVEVEPGLAPDIHVSAPDLNGRQDARGSFQRVYSRNAPLTLEAEPVYGSLALEKWVDRMGRVLATTPALTLRLADHTIVSPVYTAAAPPFPVLTRADANADGQVDMSDAIVTLAQLFQASSRLPCRASADANDDATVDVSDAIFLLNFLYQGGKAPPPPFPSCGAVALKGQLTCERFDACR